MSHPLTCLAVDFGASQGRLLLGSSDGVRITLEEVHRFENTPVRLPDGLHWNVVSLFQETLAAVGKALRYYRKAPASLGIDTWGLDFALLDRDGVLLGLPFHYRDRRTAGILEVAFRRMPPAEIFAHTGIQFMEINSLYQLLTMVIHGSPLLEVAQVLLTIPDLFNYWLTGEQACEFTNATTTQCYDSRRGQWAWPVIEAMGIPRKIFGRVAATGTVLGELRKELAEECGAGGLQVICPASHDTASAAVAVPAEGREFAYISSGTWSLVGTEVDQPVIVPSSLEHNFTNEGGAFGKALFMKNITGLWLLQECRRRWEREGLDVDYAGLAELASQAHPFRSLIDPDHLIFSPPGDMPARIARFCQQTGQPMPVSLGETVRCILESLALAYRRVIRNIEDTLSRSLPIIHIIGGGSQNEFLNQVTADATGKPVVAGPVEATAVGNIVVQLMSLGMFSGLDDARAAIRRSFELRSYEPRAESDWDTAYEHWLRIRDKSKSLIIEDES